MSACGHCPLFKIVGEMGQREAKRWHRAAVRFCKRLKSEGECMHDRIAERSDD